MRIIKRIQDIVASFRSRRSIYRRFGFSPERISKLVVHDKYGVGYQKGRESNKILVDFFELDGYTFKVTYRDVLLDERDVKLYEEG